MMYMPDAIGAMMAADAGGRRRGCASATPIMSTAMSITPAELAAEIRKHMPAFEIDYEVDPIRQAIADSWPSSLDTSAAREDWDFRRNLISPRMTAICWRGCAPKPANTPAR